MAKNKAKIIVDACCHIPNANVKGRARTGKAACGVLIIDERGNEYEYQKYLGELTPPAAEFRGLIYALDEASGVVRYDVEVWMDSELVIKWMTGEYRMRREHIRPLFDEAKKLTQRFNSVDFFHHLRDAELAKRVDKLAEEEYKKNQN